MVEVNEGTKTCGRPSRSRYMQGCRCLMCRAANADYSTRNAHEGMTSMVGEEDTAAARAKVEEWRKRGIGLRTIELYTGVSRSSLRCLLTGKGTHGDGSKPTKRMKRESYEAIMAAHPQKRGRWMKPRNNRAESRLSDWEWAEAERSYRIGELTAQGIAERYKTSAASVLKHMQRAGIACPKRKD